MKAVLNVETYLHCSQDLRGTQHGLWPGWPGLSPNLHLSDYGRGCPSTVRSRRQGRIELPLGGGSNTASRLYLTITREKENSPPARLCRTLRLGRTRRFGA